MESYSRRRKHKSGAALILLNLIGAGFLLFSLVAITCGFIINYHEDFDLTKGGRQLEVKVKSEFDYSQYWLGLPLLITGVLSIASGVLQSKRFLTTTTMTFYHICITLALFAIVLEGPDWVSWKNLDRKHRHWENKVGDCESIGTTCVCNSTSTAVKITISNSASCSNIRTLTGLYGGIVASAVTAIFLSLVGIVVMLKSISWKGPQYIEYDLRKVNPVQLYDSSHRNPAYYNGVTKEEPTFMAGMNGSGKPERLYP